MIDCNNCHKPYDADLDSCPECGEKNPNFTGESCTYCDTPILQGEKFCTGCGRPIEQPKSLCENCGGQLRPGAAFCAQCGYSVDEGTPSKEEFKQEFESIIEQSVSITPPDDDVEEKIYPPVAPPPEPDEYVDSDDDNDDDGELDWPDQPELPPAEVAPATIATLPVEEKRKKGKQASYIDEEFNKAAKKKKGGKGKIVLIVFLLILIVGILFVWIVLFPKTIAKDVAQPKELPKVEGSEHTEEVPLEPEADPAPRDGGFDFTVSYAIPAKWDIVGAFDDNGLAIVNTDGLYGIIDKSGEYVLEPEYNSIGDFHDDLAVIEKDGWYGYVNTSGEEVIKPVFTSATDFKEGTAVVSKEVLLGFIDSKGEVGEMLYRGARPFSEGFAAVTTDAGTHYIDSLGQIVSPEYEDAGDFMKGLAPIRLGGKWGYVDDGFNIVIQPQYNEGSSFDENGLAIVSDESKKFFINTAGEVSSPKVDELWAMSDGMATVKNDGRYGFVDGSKIDFTISPEYIDVLAFSDGYSAVCRDQGIWYYVDKDNKPMIEESYDQAFSFSQGFARVTIGLDKMLITPEGQQILRGEWDDIGRHSNGMVAVMENGKWGFVEIK